MFEPLGLTAPTTIKGKSGLQKLAITHLSVDDALGEQEQKWRKKWLGVRTNKARHTKMS